MSGIRVSYLTSSTAYHIQQTLDELAEREVMSFDIETKGVYTKEERAEALKLLDTEMSLYNHKLASVAASNSGLSYPSVVHVTHFVFGLSEAHSRILIPANIHEELRIWYWIRDYEGKLLIHNTLYDLKVMYHRIRSLPRNYEDTQLLAKTLTNHCDSWKAKVGLKDLMGSYYNPNWTLFDEYEPDDVRNPSFLMYAAIDGAATFKLWNDLQMHILGDTWSDESERDFK